MDSACRLKVRAISDEKQTVEREILCMKSVVRGHLALIRMDKGVPDLAARKAIGQKALNERGGMFFRSKLDLAFDLY